MFIFTYSVVGRPKPMSQNVYSSKTPTNHMEHKYIGISNMHHKESSV